MVEPEMAFYDLTDNMDLAEAFLKRIITDALEQCAEDMKFFAERIDKELFARLEERAEQPVPAGAVHRGGRHPAEVAARRASSRSRGATTCRASTSAT